MYLLGFDIGSSSVKVSIVDGASSKSIASAFYPKQEMKITALKPGWAEQDPEMWWDNLKLALSEVLNISKINPADIYSIGISYQMHGLVMVDKTQTVIRPSIIWCDSRAAQIGDTAFHALGEENCLSTLLNSPGNFTASKLKWVKENEPNVYNRISKIMLPGDYIAMKLSGDIKTTASGLSEGIFWDFKDEKVSDMILDYYGFSNKIIPEITPTFSVQGIVSNSAAKELGLLPGIKIGYRAGDQPNNALSLNVLNPGEVAATAGTSGVVYGVSDELKYDTFSRINTFAHVNHNSGHNRLGVLLCINGAGIQNAWMKRTLATQARTYDQMNQQALNIPIGSEGIIVLPFGNGAERILRNEDIGSHLSGINFNIHNPFHLYRAAQEGIAFSFKYGMEIMKQVGIDTKIIRAGKTNMFLSQVFRDTLASVSNATIELYDTDGSVGAALGGGIGAGFFASAPEAFANLQKLDTIEPDHSNREQYMQAYSKWKSELEKVISK